MCCNELLCLIGCDDLNVEVCPLLSVESLHHAVEETGELFAYLILE